MNFNSIQFTQSPTTPQLPIGGSKKLMKIVNYFLTNLVTFHAYSTSIHASILFFIQNYCFWLTCQIVLAETNFIWLIMSTSFYKCLNLLETWRGQDSLDFFSWTFFLKIAKLLPKIPAPPSVSPCTISIFIYFQVVLPICIPD